MGRFVLFVYFVDRFFVYDRTIHETHEQHEITRSIAHFAKTRLSVKIR